MAADETIVLGAKDRASKILDKIGDNNRRLGQRVKAMSKSSVAATRKVTIGFKGLLTTTGPLLAAFAAVKAAGAAFRVIGESAEAFDIQQEAVRGLTQAIELSGDKVGPTVEQHKAFASALQGSANVGDEVTLGLMKQASMLGVSNDKLQAVTKATIGMSEATGISLDEALRKVNKTVSGNTEIFGEYVPQLRQAANDEERLAIISETANKGLAQKAERAKTAQGAAERLSNRWGDFLEVIGKALAPVRQFVSEGLAMLTETISARVMPAAERGAAMIQSLGPIFKSLASVVQNVGVVLGVWGETVMSILGSVMGSFGSNSRSVEDWGETIKSISQSVARGVIRWLTMLEVGWTNLGRIVGMAGDTVELALVGMMENIKHALTVQAPALLRWFQDNWRNILSDTFSATLTAAKNYATNMTDIWKRLWEFIASGAKGGFGTLVKDVTEIASRDLLEGFKANTDPLPELIGRQITEREQELAARVGKTGNEIGEEFKQKFEERVSRLGFDAAQKAAEKAKIEPIKIGMGAEVDEKVDEIQKKVQDGVKVSGSVSVEAKESRLLTRGRQENEQVEATRKSNKELSEMKQIQRQQLELQRQQLEAQRRGKGTGLAAEIVQ